MLRHAPVNIPLACNDFIEFCKKVFSIHVFIVFFMSHAAVSVPVLVNTNKHACVCVPALDCIIGHAKCLCILSDIMIPVRPHHVIPCAHIHFVTDNKVFKRRTQRAKLEFRCNRLDSLRIGRVEHVISGRYGMRIHWHRFRSCIRIGNCLIRTSIHHLNCRVLSCKNAADISRKI